MVVEFDSSGRGASQTFQIDNYSEKDIPIEIEAMTRKIDIDNKETRGVTKDFVVYPMQIVVKAKEKRNIRVIWTGGYVPESEIPYRLALRQLPVDFKVNNSSKPSTQIKFLFEYVASLYVMPKKVIPAKLEVESVKRVNDVAIVIVNNIGNVHVLFKQFDVFVSVKGGKKIEIPVKNLENYLAYNLLAGDRRRIKIPLPKDLAAGDVVVEFTGKQ